MLTTWRGGRPPTGEVGGHLTRYGFNARLFRTEHHLPFSCPPGRGAWVNGSQPLVIGGHEACNFVAPFSLRTARLKHRPYPFKNRVPVRPDSSPTAFGGSSGHSANPLPLPRASA